MRFRLSPPVMVGNGLTLLTLLAALPPVSADATTTDVAHSSVEFGFQLYRRVASAPKTGNVLLSPFSIHRMLTAAWAGAGGETARQMEEVLYTAAPAGAVCDDWNKRSANLVAAAKSSGIELTAATTVWPDSGALLRKSYLNTIGAGEFVTVEPIDFSDSAAVAKINDWIAAQTKGKITELFDRLPPLTKLVLTDAVYFKGRWTSSFARAATHDEPFFLRSGDRVDVPMMRRKAPFLYASVSVARQNIEIVELPYGRREAASKLSMLIMLPANLNGMRAIEEVLSDAALREWTSALRYQEVDVHVPRFRMRARTEGLKTILAALAMSDAFDPEKADFSGMTGRRDLYLAEVVHEAAIEVGERGTEAASSARAIMALSGVSSRHLIFRVDRPFLFAIRDSESGMVLFLGRVVDPR